MEEVLDSFRSSTVGWLRGTLAGWATILLAIGGLVGAALGVSQWLLLLPLVSVAIIGTVWIRNMASKFEITNERLLVRRGIFFKSVDEIELYRVKDARLDFTLINQLAGIGTLTIRSSDETTRNGDLRIPHVEKASERRETLRRLVDVARHKRQVREIDMVHDHERL